MGEKLEEKGTKFKVFACYKGMEAKYQHKKKKDFCYKETEIRYYHQKAKGFCLLQGLIIVNVLGMIEFIWAVCWDHGQLRQAVSKSLS